MALQANYGALEFNWLLGRDIVQKKAETRWGSGVVNQLSLDLRGAYPDVKGYKDRLPYVEELTKLLDMVEHELREYKERDKSDNDVAEEPKEQE